MIWTNDGCRCLCRKAFKRAAKMLCGLKMARNGLDQLKRAEQRKEFCHA
jgi:hypothetical protein